MPATNCTPRSHDGTHSQLRADSMHHARIRGRVCIGGSRAASPPVVVGDFVNRSCRRFTSRAGGHFARPTPPPCPCVPCRNRWDWCRSRCRSHSRHTPFPCATSTSATPASSVDTAYGASARSSARPRRKSSMGWHGASAGVLLTSAAHVSHSSHLAFTSAS